MTKTHYWIDHESSGETIEITIRDQTDAKLESWKIDKNDTKRLKQIFKILEEKWNVNLSSAFIRKEKDLKWLE